MRVRVDFIPELFHRAGRNKVTTHVRKVTDWKASGTAKRGCSPDSPLSCSIADVALRFPAIFPLSALARLVLFSSISRVSPPPRPVPRFLGTTFLSTFPRHLSPSNVPLANLGSRRQSTPITTGDTAADDRSVHYLFIITTCIMITRGHASSSSYCTPRGEGRGTSRRFSHRPRRRLGPGTAASTRMESLVSW